VKNILPVVALFLLPLAVHAAPAAEAPPPSYSVELVVFQNLRSDLDGGELWVSKLVPADAATPGQTVAATGPVPQDSELAKAKAALEKSGDYAILAHRFWVQEARPETEASRMSVKGENNGLDGTVQFFMSRFLHVAMNLGLNADGATTASAASDTLPGGDMAPLVYRIEERRRVKSNDIQFFDHPRFGVLLQVKPIEPAEKAGTGKQ
jgi:hypothetical protein